MNSESRLRYQEKYINYLENELVHRMSDGEKQDHREFELCNEEMIHQLTVNEIDQIISFLQEPYHYELIKRLENLKEQYRFKKSSEKKKTIWLTCCENKVYREILGAYSAYEKAEAAAIDSQNKFNCSGSWYLNFYVVEVEFDKENG